jgi:ERCC4-related helicase
MLKALRDQWDKVTIDPKIDIFLEKLPDFLDKQSNPEQKIVIFTESTDTMKYVLCSGGNNTGVG